MQPPQPLVSRPELGASWASHRKRCPSKRQPRCGAAAASCTCSESFTPPSWPPWKAVWTRSVHLWCLPVPPPPTPFSVYIAYSGLVHYLCCNVKNKFRASVQEKVLLHKRLKLNVFFLNYYSALPFCVSIFLCIFTLSFSLSEPYFWCVRRIIPVS